jgi:hypothetical protein
MARIADVGAFLVAQRLRLGPDGTEHPLGATVWIYAPDGGAAIQVLKNLLADYGQFSDFTAIPVNFHMYLGFLESERGAIEAVSHEVGLEDPRVSMVVIHEPTKGSAELVLEIPAADKEAAVVEALNIYRDLRDRAGLQAAEPLYGFLGPTGYFPTTPIAEPARHEELAQRAEKLFAEGVYDYAVVAAQTSCERMVFDGITELIESNGDTATGDMARAWFDQCGQAPSMRDERLQKLWTVLTGDKVQEKPWWAAYKGHTVRRHGVVHRGTEPAKSEARDSLDAAAAFRGHIKAKLDDALGRPQR